MTVVYPSFAEMVIFSILGFICGYIARILIAIVAEGIRSAIFAVKIWRVKRKIHREGTTWDEAIAAFKRPDDSPS